MERGRIIVVGAGGAGLTAAIAARKGGAEVVLLSKTACGDANCTAYSGGFFSLASGSISPEAHFERVFETGCRVNDPLLVRTLAENCESSLRAVAEWGVAIKINDSGRATVRSTAPSAIMGGGGLTRELTAIAKREGVRILENHIVTRLLLGERSVQGIECVDWKNGKAYSFGASAVILATGGGGAIYERTDNPLRMSGDGYALALEAGLDLVDMEYVQFYPMGWDQEGYPVWMVGLTILDYIPVTDENGREFLKEALPAWGVKTGKEANLFARDRASVFLAGHAGRGGKTLLHLEALKEEDLLIPDVQESLMLILPPERRRAPVRVNPIQHYFTGGVRIDSEGRTTLPGLFACGEVTGGVDGASRMGGNALTNILTFGLRAGKAAARETAASASFTEKQLGDAAYSFRSDESGVSPTEARATLRRIVQQGLGPWRAGDEIERSLEELETLEASNSRMRLTNSSDLLHALEIRGLLRTAEAVGKAALLREESRGVHFREDFPEEREEWRRRILVGCSDGVLRARLEHS